jgi:diguanylate cyclase (GGDEF)-like protein
MTAVGMAPRVPARWLDDTWRHVADVEPHAPEHIVGGCDVADNLDLKPKPETSRRASRASVARPLKHVPVDDQTLADDDQTASDADQGAALDDQADADRDQSASDRDQDRSDHERSAHTKNWSAADEAEYRAARAARRAGSSDRSETGTGRLGTADRRDVTSDRRDGTATERDTARRSSDDLEARRLTSGRRVDLIRQLEALRAQSAVERAQAARDRARAAADRRQSAADRERATADRARAAAFRLAAGQHRDRLDAELQEAHLDGVTGVYRRDMGDQMLSREIDRARRSDGQFVVGFVDVDRLKAINDRDGHAAGDRVLEVVARSIREHIRSFDLVFRYGGDEFVCGLSGVALAGARARFDQIERLIRTESGAEISTGLAMLADGDDPADLVQRADAAMRAVKATRQPAPMLT